MFILESEYNEEFADPYTVQLAVSTSVEALKAYAYEIGKTPADAVWNDHELNGKPLSSYHKTVKDVYIIRYLKEV